MMRRTWMRLASGAAAGTPVMSAPPVEEYDAIVVGAGASGCLIAGRFAMDNLRTLVLEEGVDIGRKPSWYWTLPSRQLAHRVAHRGYESADTVTTPQHWPDGSTSSVNIPTPRVLGGHGVMGSSSWNLGDERDWADTPYKFREDLLPTLRAFENMQSFAPHRGKKGKFLICRPESFSPLFKPVCEAISKDLPLFSEFTKKDFRIPCGCGRPDSFADQGTGIAHSSLQRYLLDMVMLGRPLAVRCEAKAVGIRPSGGDKSLAAGVTYRARDGQLVDVNAPLVVVAAGAIGTPRLLAASRGAVTVDASIGEGFWDVPQAVVQFAVKQPISHNCFFDPLVRAYLAARLHVGKPLPSLCSSWDDLIMYWSSTGDMAKPDVEIVFQPFTLNSDGTQPLPGRHGAQFLVRPLRPKSRGKVLPDGSLDPAYFTAPEDAEAVKKAIEYVKDTLPKRPSLVPLLGELVQVRMESSGMCGGAAFSAVDPASLLAKGLANVYVAGSSVLPCPLSGALLPYTLTAADRLADRVLRKRTAERRKTDTKEDESTRIVY